MPAANHLTTAVRPAVTPPAPAPLPAPAPVGASRPSPRHGSWQSDASAHLIRLCLDLQLDALMLTLGAAAAGHEESTATPWIRWVSEDVRTACALAADVRDGGASLPHPLGTELDHELPDVAVDNLVARYESMAALLSDVLRPARAHEPAPERPRVRQVLEQCERRLGELRANRMPADPMPPDPMPADPAAGRSGPGRVGGVPPHGVRLRETQRDGVPETVLELE